MDEMYEDMTIDELSVDKKVKETLQELGFRYVRQLENRNIRRIYELVILGPKYIEQLEEQLYQLDVELKNESDEKDTEERFKKWKEDENRFKKWRAEMSIKKSEGKNFQSANIRLNDKNNGVISNDGKGERD